MDVRLKRYKIFTRKKFNVQRKLGRRWKTCGTYTSEDDAVDRLVEIAEIIRKQRDYEQ